MKTTKPFCICFLAFVGLTAPPLAVTAKANDLRHYAAVTPNPFLANFFAPALTVCRPPCGMGASHTISKLTRTYALLLGKYEVIEREIEHVGGVQNMLREISRIEREKRAMLKQLDAIATTAKLIEPKWKREAVQPIYPYKTDHNSKLIGVTIYRVLGDTDKPLRTREISRQVAESLGIELCQSELARLDKNVYVMLKSKVGKTIQMSADRPIQWSLIPRDQARSPGKRAYKESPAQRDGAA